MNITNPGPFAVAIPRDIDTALAMKAVAEAWLGAHTTTAAASTNVTDLRSKLRMQNDRVDSLMHLLVEQDAEKAALIAAGTSKEQALLDANDRLVEAQTRIEQLQAQLAKSTPLPVLATAMVTGLRFGMLGPDKPYTTIELTTVGDGLNAFNSLRDAHLSDKKVTLHLEP